MILLKLIFTSLTIRCLLFWHIIPKLNRFSKIKVLKFDSLRSETVTSHLRGCFFPTAVPSVRWKILLQFQCRNRLLLTGTPIQNTMAEVRVFYVQEWVGANHSELLTSMSLLSLSCGPCCTSSCPHCLIPTKNSTSGSPKTSRATLRTNRPLMRVSLTSASLFCLYFLQTLFCM